MRIKDESRKDLDDLYLSLASDVGLWELSTTKFMQSMCESIAHTMQVERATIYVLASDEDSVNLENQYILTKQKHYSDYQFKKSSYPMFFETLKSYRILDIPDAKNDPLFGAYEYMRAFNIGASLCCTIYHAGKLVGLVSAEQVAHKRIWTQDEKRFLSSMSDLISKRVIAMKVEEEKDERYRSVFENSGDAMYLMKDNAFVDCNQALFDLLACSREDVFSRTPSHFSPEFQPNGLSSRNMGKEKIDAALAGKKQNFEFTYSRLDGVEIPTELTLSRVEIKGDVLILAIVRDISARKIAEHEIILSRERILEQNKGLSLINELSNQLQGAYTTDEIYEKTIDAIAKTLTKPKISIFNIDNEKKLLYFKIARRHRAEDISKLSVIPLNPNFHQAAMETGGPIYVPDIKNDKEIFPQVKKALQDMGFQSMILLPFMVNNVRTAILYLVYDEIGSMHLKDLDVLASMSKTVSLALDNAHTHSELEYLAHRDSLTGLGNRAYFHRQFHLKIKPESNTHAALYLLDLDRFKEINDTLGHFTGDKLLQKIGPRLNTAIINYEFLVSRLGGDEFIILVYGIDDPGEASDLALNILECLRMPFQVDDLILEIDSSLGIAMYPKDGNDSHALLRSADVAMYQAKHAGKGYKLYEPDSDIHTPERLAMIAELGSSIRTGQLFLHYQPKIDLQTNEVLGFEALARWEHPRLGLLSPSLFVPLIEMSNSIFQLTEEVLHQALSQQRQWRKEGFNYTIAVNLSSRNLIDDRIINLLENLLRHYDVPANMLELEITETALMHDIYHASDYLKQISNLGIELSIDDFGTGYSSLAYLNKLPVNKIKLDREFIMGMLDSEQGDITVRKIIELSKSLDLQVVAEGVEDQSVLDKLRDMNCDQAQGYCICKPDIWGNIEKWLKR